MTSLIAGAFLPGCGVQPGPLVPLCMCATNQTVPRDRVRFRQVHRHTRQAYHFHRQVRHSTTGAAHQSCKCRWSCRRGTHRRRRHPKGQRSRLFTSSSTAGAVRPTDRHEPAPHTALIHAHMYPSRAAVRPAPCTERTRTNVSKTVGSNCVRGRRRATHRETRKRGFVVGAPHAGGGEHDVRR